MEWKSNCITTLFHLTWNTGSKRQSHHNDHINETTACTSIVVIIGSSFFLAGSVPSEVKRVVGSEKVLILNRKVSLLWSALIRGT